MPVDKNRRAYGRFLRMERKEEHKGSAPAWRKRLVIIIVFVVISSIAIRVAMGKSESTTKQTTAKTDGTANSVGPGGASFLPGLEGGDERPPADETVKDPSTAEKVLPFVTEGGLAMLLGLGLGIATRAVAKFLIVGMAIIFVVIQYLAYKGMLTVDWGAMGGWIKNFVLNISGENGISKIVQHKLPSAGSLGMGYYLGLKKGD